MIYTYVYIITVFVIKPIFVFYFILNIFIYIRYVNKYIEFQIKIKMIQQSLTDSSCRSLLTKTQKIIMVSLSRKRN